MRDACAVADDVRSGRLRAGDVLEECLRTIRSREPVVNAFVCVDESFARAQAARVDARVAAGEDPGPLAGVPVGVKDVEPAAGFPYRGAIATEDSPQVARLRAAGCVIVGKTSTPESPNHPTVCRGAGGRTTNPADPKRTAGGSSGGSAAAVAAGMTLMATGYDGGGSIRIPAAYCGVVGMKPTARLVPRLVPSALPIAVGGPLARSVRDAARYLDCAAGADERDPFSLPHPGRSFEDATLRDPSGVRAALVLRLGRRPDREVAELVQTAAEALDASGVVRVEERELDLLDVGAAWQTLRRLDNVLSGRQENLARRSLAQAFATRDENNVRLARLFAEVDVLLTPTVPSAAFELKERLPGGMHVDFTWPFNVSGHPAISVPCGSERSGAPVGLQIVGRRHADHTVLAVGAALTRLTWLDA